MHLSLHRLKLYCKTMGGLLKQHCPTIGQLDSRTPHRLIIGLLRQSTALQLDCLEQHCLTIGQLDKAQFDHLTVEQPLGSLTQHSLFIGLLDTALSNHWTV